MTSVTFTWETQPEHREYAFWKHQSSSADAIINVNSATYVLDPAVYDLFWAAVGQPDARAKLRITANGATLKLIDRRITANGTGSGTAQFEVT